MKKRYLRKTVTCGVLALMIGIGASAALGHNNQGYEPDCEVITYHFNGFSCTKTIQKLPPSTARAIKEDYHIIQEKNLDTYDEIIQKQEVLTNYGLLTSPLTLENYYPRTSTVTRILDILKTPNTHENQGRFLLLGILGSINGEFYGQTINFLNFRLAGLPFIVFGTGGCEIRLVDLLYLGQPQYFSTDAGYLYCALFFLGQITMTPFLDTDGGQITGVTLATLALGGK